MSDHIPLCIPSLFGNEWSYVKDCLDTNWVSSVGGYVDRFEREFATYLGAPGAVVTMNGTSALLLALQMIGIGPGDEVVVPSLTFVASVNPILYVGATPVFCDVRPDTWCMDMARCAALVTPRTRAVVPVHLYGNAADMDALIDLRDRCGFAVVEDATESLGTRIRGRDGVWRQTGTIGDFGAFSFNGNKLLTTGAGGMLVSMDEARVQRGKYLSNQAKTMAADGAMEHVDVGYNYRMPNVLAALGVAQLEGIEARLREKRRQAARYRSGLAGVSGISLMPEADGVDNCCWLFGIVLEEGFPVSADELVATLRAQGIESRPFFRPLHAMPPYRGFPAGDLSVTMRLARRGVSLPSTVGLPDEDVDRVCDAIRSVIR
jgi:perosamine synthetase